MPAAEYWLLGRAPTGSATTARSGLVRADRKVIRDDTGLFHPLGCTFFWMMQGWKHERPRVDAHLDYLATYKPDYIRTLGYVDWKDRGIDPAWPDYEQVLGESIDAAYARGIRTQVTLVGGKQGDTLWPVIVDKVARVVNNGRTQKLFAAEIVNERDRLDKMTFANMEKAGKQLRTLLPNNLIGLSRPAPKKGEHDDSGFKAMFDAMKRSGTNLFIQHPRRSDDEFGWDHVSQGYDFHLSSYPGSNNEPEGPQSSEESESRPLFLAMARALDIVCGGACYCFHPGQMVTGHVDPAHGRPANLWEVPNIDACLKAVRGVDALLPDGVENWQVVNNARDDHPLPLPKPAFWSDPKYSKTGWMNKNYAALSPDGRSFVVLPAGVRAPADGELVVAGAALKACHVEAFDPVSQQQVDSKELATSQAWSLPGRKNTEAGYIVRGEFR